MRLKSPLQPRCQGLVSPHPLREREIRQKRPWFLQSGWTIPTNVRGKEVHRYTPVIAIPLARTTRTLMSLNNVFIRISNDPKTKIDTQSYNQTDKLLSSFCTFFPFDRALKLYVQNRLFLASFCRYRYHERNKGTKQYSSTGGFIVWLYCFFCCT